MNIGFNFTTIFEDLENFLENHNLEISKVPGDGHCFIHAIIKSLASQNKSFEYEAFLNFLKDYAKQNVERYLGFFENEKCSPLLLLETYFKEKI